jgi:hypothetical protein
MRVVKAQVRGRFTKFRTRFCCGSSSVDEEPKALGFDVAAGRRLQEQVGQLTVIRIEDATPL